jgi:hypothetical protein
MVIAFLVVALALAISAPAGAQVVPAAPPPAADSTPVPSSTPDPVSEAEADGAGAPVDEQEMPEARDDAVPEEEEEASSDRIRYRDPLDIKEEPLKLKWNNFLKGLRGITQYSLFDNQLRFRLGFRLQADGTLVRPSSDLEAALGDMPNGVDFRRFRLFAEGILRKMYFRVEFDFAADAGFKSVYLEGREGGLEIWGHLLGRATTSAPWSTTRRRTGSSPGRPARSRGARRPTTTPPPRCSLSQDGSAISRWLATTEARSFTSGSQ